jgi:transcriptional regulator with XRE-family HTH domain
MKHMDQPVRPEPGTNPGAKITLLGVSLRQLRQQKGWTMGQLAAVSKVDKSTISRLENGQIRTVQEENLVALARALEVDPEVLRELGQRPAAPPPAALWTGVFPPAEAPRLEGTLPSFSDYDEVMQCLGGHLQTILQESDLAAVRSAGLSARRLVELVTEEALRRIAALEGSRGLNGRESGTSAEGEAPAPLTTH